MPVGSAASRSLLILCVALAVLSLPSCKKEVPLDDFFPKGGVVLPPVLAKSTWDQSEQDLYAAVPEFGGEQDFKASGTIERVARDTSFGGLYAFRLTIAKPAFPDYLKQRWGAGEQREGLMAPVYHWRNAKAGVRAEVTEETGSNGERWELDYYQYKPLDGLFPAGAMKPPGDLAKAIIGMKKSEALQAVPAFKEFDNYYDLHGGYEDVRFWFQLDGDRVKELTVTFGSKKVLPVLTAAWGKPEKDGKGRAYWVNSDLEVRTEIGAEKGVRATFSPNKSGNDALQFTPESKGDYSEW